MDFSANHIGFVIASYGLTFVCLAILIASTVMKDRRLRTEAMRLDAQRKRGKA